METVASKYRQSISCFLSGVPFSKQILSFRKQKLEDGKTLSKYRVAEGSTIDLRHADKMKIFVNYLGSHYLIFFVNASDTVESLMAKIEEKEGKVRDFCYICSMCV